MCTGTNNQIVRVGSQSIQLKKEKLVSTNSYLGLGLNPGSFHPESAALPSEPLHFFSISLDLPFLNLKESTILKQITTFKIYAELELMIWG